MWIDTPHSHATQTLVGLTPARHHDPECLSCHTTGWEPQKYFPFRSGFMHLDKTSHLRANGCENCHGPGSEHVAAEEGDAEDDELNARRAQMRLTLKQAEAHCVQCHDLDNSPDFDFETYWPEVEHYGKE